jgi:hypothetical protein
LVHAATENTLGKNAIDNWLDENRLEGSQVLGQTILAGCSACEDRANEQTGVDGPYAHLISPAKCFKLILPELPERPYHTFAWHSRG